jgi:arsenical pump membrane protein
MNGISIAQAATWSIAAFATGGVIFRPWGLPEAVWAIAGAAALVVSALLPWQDALAAIAKGTDVYLFLTGMMLLADLARREGLFDWVATHAAKAAKGSPARLFGLVYLAGIVVTVFLSNDATAVVLTPAVYAAARAAKAKPLPYLVICAFIANAASFVLPISNPANLVLYGHEMPPLWPWLKQFALPSALSIAATYVALRWIFRDGLKGEINGHAPTPSLSNGGRYAAYGLGAAVPVLLLASAFGFDLGAPTVAAGAATAIFVLAEKREAPWHLLKEVSWSVLPLVAGLFVLVEGLNNTGAVAQLTALLNWGAEQSVPATAWSAGLGLAFVTNLMNNLPAGLIAQSAAIPAHAPGAIKGALLVGVDLGPNLSVTGSLATILWLIALRREGESCTAAEFLKIGAIAMPPALILALGALILTS